MNNHEAAALITSEDADISRRIEAVDHIAAVEAESGSFVAQTSLPSERGDASLAEPCLVDKYKLSAKHIAVIAAALVAAAVIVALFTISTEDAAPILAWFQSWLP